MKLIHNRYIPPPEVESSYECTILMTESERIQIIQVLRQGLQTEVGKEYSRGAKELLRVLGVQP